MKTDAPAIIRARRELALAAVRPAERKTTEGRLRRHRRHRDRTLPGRYIIRSCEQMRNRGNGKGGGVAAVGLFGDRKDHYAIHIAYLDEGAREELERDFS